ncbi:hypothetical protein [Peptostreptococcus equinus]|uniref:Lipoprotein n=1 Tax=Peptostreptococcus equinus TaxID=3003601 RepID=A0ABY7JSG6_9FIRM|nr:hypothetical protein [Peptostreptococcus sp. CBA3647]WAW14647.1 hypothetical protein O0R46_08590 [Peptostreptococcus sp. CBA3647]
MNDVEKKKKGGCFKVGCLIVIIIFVVGTIIGSLLSDKEKTATNKTKVEEKQLTDNTTNDLPVVFDTKKYINKTKDDIINELGQPQSTDKFDWDSQGSGDKYNISTLSYKKDNIDYEYWFYKDKLVRINIDNENGIEFGTKNQLSILNLDTYKYKVKNINVAIDFVSKEAGIDESIPEQIRFMQVENSKAKNIKIIYNMLVAGQ